MASYWLLRPISEVLLWIEYVSVKVIYLSTTKSLFSSFDLRENMKFIRRLFLTDNIIEPLTNGKLTKSFRNRALESYSWTNTR